MAKAYKVDWTASDVAVGTYTIISVGVTETNLKPIEFALYPSHPNPFNPSTTIRFDLPVGTDIRIVVYDLMCWEVVRLVDQHLDPGFHQVIWNGRDAKGRGLPTGIYIARIVTREFSKSIKMVLLK